MPQCHSTNTLAADLSQKEDIAEGTVVITDDQFAGKGQRGSTWVAAPGQNLTVSVIFRPKFLSPLRQFQINRVVSLAVSDYIQSRLPGHPVAIKWPNDIMVGPKKAAGILIENHVSSVINTSIAGMGININQESFPYPKATSLKVESQQTFDLNHELSLLLGYLEVRYLELRQGSQNSLENSYLARLYKHNQPHVFTANGRAWEGTITGVDEVGRLKVLDSGEERVFGVKEISF